MVLARRDSCFVDDAGYRQCYIEDSFWYTDKGIIIKWVILMLFFGVFFAWFVGGYMHAKQRLRKGLPLLAYHRFLVSHSDRRRHAPPQNHFTFYQTQNPYQPHQQANPAYRQRTDGAWAEPPPLYQNTDAPPMYYPPPTGATKMDPNQGGSGGAGGVELPQYGVAPHGMQQSCVVGVGPSANASGSGHVEQGGPSTAGLPPRPETAKTRLMGVEGRFRR